jgi:hypothetical protein
MLLLTVFFLGYLFLSFVVTAALCALLGGTCKRGETTVTTRSQILGEENVSALNDDLSDRKVA